MKNKFFAAILVILLAVIFFLANRLMHERSVVNDGKIWGILYQQKAAEYRALCFQAYNTATRRVYDSTKANPNKKYAIITDIDETLLDNSPYDGLRALEDSDYSSTDTKKWTAQAMCDTVPGAAQFLKYAHERGVSIFYITNRAEAEKVGTKHNLHKFALPDTDNLLLETDPKVSSKELRRQQVINNGQHLTLLLLCGDNLPDFDKAYDNKPDIAKRKATTDQLESYFGNKYIILPNADYDDWENAYYHYNYSLTHKQKDSIIVSLLNVDTAKRK
jgi:5'-nucleotidase (lipoprotein e(P4) family)